MKLTKIEIIVFQTKSLIILMSETHLKINNVFGRKNCKVQFETNRNIIEGKFKKI